MQSKLDEPRKSVRKGMARSEDNEAHREYTVALALLTLHLDVVIAPLLDFAYGKRCFHEPGQKRIEYEYNLTWRCGTGHRVEWRNDLPQNQS